MSTESELDERLEELEQTYAGKGANKLTVIMGSFHLRAEYEHVAAAYLSLLRKGSGSDAVALKLLRTLDGMRARDISIQELRLAPLAPDKRPAWSGVYSDTDFGLHCSRGRQPKSYRTVRPYFGAVGVSNPSDDAELIDFPWKNAAGTDILDLSSVLLLHLGFVDQELVIALDANLERFFYGPTASSGEGTITNRTFSELAYDPSQLDPGLVEVLPPRRSNARTRVRDLVERWHRHCDDAIKANRHPSERLLEGVMIELDELTRIPEIIDSLERWVKLRNSNLRDVCLVILPDEGLFMLPLSFLGFSRAMPLVTTLGGVTMGISLVALKHSAAHYHYTTLPNVSRDAPRCYLCATDAYKTGLLVGREAQLVQEAFGGECYCKVRVGSVTVEDFRRNYLAGDVCWFAGHGGFEVRGLEVEGETVPLPLGGPAFVDGALTSLHLWATSNWNFKCLWLTVMNCCVVGRALVMGRNPLGFVSALYSAGSIATIAALWHLLDGPAIAFAERLAGEIKANYHRDDYPRARAFSNAIRKALSEEPYGMSLYAPYVLWGLP